MSFNNETWRIIGLVNGYIKIIKEEPITGYKWDNAGNNIWNNASLQTYLNEEYYNNLSPDAQNMIQSATYNLGKMSSTDTTVLNIYNFENSSTDNIVSKINLMYVSDYGYSVIDSCPKTPYNYETNNYCNEDGTWLYRGQKEWLLNRNTSTGRSGYINASGYIASIDTDSTSTITRPTLYLNSSVNIISGDGSSQNPYTLSSK